MIAAIGFVLVLAAVAGVAWGPRVTVKSEAKFANPESRVTVSSINVVQEPAWPVAGMFILGAVLAGGGFALSRYRRD